jgi:hypothetical protein
MRVKVEGALTLVVGITALFKVGRNLAEGAEGVEVAGAEVAVGEVGAEVAVGEVGAEVAVGEGDWLQHRGSMMMRKGRGKEVK